MVNRLPYLTSNGYCCFTIVDGEEGGGSGVHHRRTAVYSVIAAAVFADDVEVIKRRYINFSPPYILYKYIRIYHYNRGCVSIGVDVMS